jgi:2-oxoglutarate ferredoxin oxidoreductase subunit delta
MAKVKGAIVIDIQKCKGCEVCLEACPSEVIRMSKEVNNKGYHYSYVHVPDACTGCANCAIVCPDGVITVYRAKVEV